jgi:hypothetical protein
MSFQDDCDDDPIVFTREHTQIVITCTDGSHVQTIDLPALTIRRSEASPEWLAAEEASNGS